MARAARRPAARRARGLRRDPAQRLGDGRAAVHEPRRPSRLLRVHPVLGHLAGRARRLRREREQRLRRLVDGVGGAEPARARGARLVQGLGRLSAGGRGRPRQRRLGGEHDRARLRARVRVGHDGATTSSPTSPTRRTRRSRAPPASSGFARSRCACCPSTSAIDCAPTLLAAAMDADLAAGRRPLFVVRERRRDEHRRRRSAARARRHLPRAGRLVPRRRRLRRLRRARRAPAGRSSRASNVPTRSRSIRTSGSTSRTSAAACSSATAPALEGAFSITPDYLKDAIASAGEINFSDLGMQLTRSSRALKIWRLDSVRSASTRFAGDRPHARARRRRQRTASTKATSSSCWRRRRSGSSASGGVSGGSTTRRRSSG